MSVTFNVRFDFDSILCHLSSTLGRLLTSHTPLNLNQLNQLIDSSSIELNCTDLTMYTLRSLAISVGDIVVQCITEYVFLAVDRVLVVVYHVDSGGALLYVQTVVGFFEDY